MTDPLTTATLADAEKYLYKAECKKCKHKAEIDLVALRDKLGPQFHVRDISEHLRCKCGHRSFIISFFDRSWSFVGRK